MEPNDQRPADIDQQIRINELREGAREAAGGEITSWESDDTPPEIAEQFWQNVLAYEQAEMTSHFDQLVERGVELPPPGEMDDNALTDKLSDVICELAKMDVYLSSTDHLSDRQLYTALWDDLLREEGPALPPGAGWICHLDVLGGCSDDDIYLQMMHYADEEERQQWRRDYPDDPMPDHVDPPYDRDRHLPKPADDR